MSLSSRSLLPLLLVILQFFAPLLHAHTGAQQTHFGLHVPGLESFGSTSAAAMSVQPELHVSNTGDCIVAIDDGMREKRIQSEEHSASDCLPVLTWILKTPAASNSSAEFPQPPLLLSRPRSPALSPRAPPIS
ncbi:hypothetical protein [Methylomicrobium sp. Wu6]|uniref:hypothetical protein n=1 Tax=Methylomicrobium sp. Wu6 TaxID=3107928 RepID=UPI002DD63652|nr:hypothetical protein [Methylomicrobium sp. Wu6]MEC4749906.1 hypothetical protein [Methylomicrobium sp. Wu6]